MGIGVFYKEQGKNLIAVSPTVDKVDEPMSHLIG